MRFLVTGAAGFIGMHVTQSLLSAGHEVVGIDNLNNYHHDMTLKIDRLSTIGNSDNFTFIKCDIANREVMENLFRDHGFQRVIHLAAYAGVRNSLFDPVSYVNSNILGYLNILEGCRYNKVEHLLYASSSSVYGLNDDMPYKIDGDTTHPISFYAVTKKSNELMAHSYSYLYGIPTTGLRFFTVYGPWGRPDMALFKFTKAILSGEKIDVYNYGNMKRDFTYIDDLVTSVMALQDIIPTNRGIDLVTKDVGYLSNRCVPYQIYNIGNSEPVSLISYIHALEKSLGRVADKNMMPIQAGDMLGTHADISLLVKVLGSVSHTSVEVGVSHFVSWYNHYYNNMQ
ncbi:NAD-dependent epimerase/dehydratase family protein [Candidatus Erwinia haradaeae]|uniref:NAD dependent epimerase/dehydratase family protein n=1 Tax=Candidatus Erwinia haradaeae TaxID=1922217 RepID=A0A451D7Q1_9GAMM|nr:NAD-dependent epimerase/dehydratase family protein [Candidatus Erwinia haradaeae]VFP81848.1 NAD dependent epimerase/dehydratase family protein [Candidatus Erwinia haradaeae]